jgi:hypothetical protein
MDDLCENVKADGKGDGISSEKLIDHFLLYFGVESGAVGGFLVCDIDLDDFV